MKKTFYLFLVFTLTSFILNAQVYKKPAPNWVKKIDYSNTPQINEEEIIQGNLVLLYDEQIQVDKEENYFKFVTKITENVGVQPASSINVVFDPTYQTLTFNSLKIIRDNTVVDKLSTSDFQTMRREMNAESYIYDGSLSAFTNISDVRNGDIIEYSYTVKGFNPIHKDFYSASFNVDTGQPMGKMFIELTSKKPLKYKVFNNNDFSLKETKQNGNHVYTIKRENVEAFKYEDGTPVWEITSGYVSISNYKSWEDVINWGTKLFKVNGKLSPSLHKKINEIKRNNATDSDKISATLNFVQNEIRYLGLESGIGAYKPFSPNKVFKQRYGDCKDKSLLMVTMLRNMGIEAYPMLVNTYLKETIKKLQPAAEHFNHCVVKVKDGKGTELWYDPTITNQGGSHDKVTFPDYRYGLVLKEENTSFDDIFPFHDNLVEITDNYVINKEGKGGTLEITSAYYDGQADNMRSFFKNNSISTIKKEYERYYAKYFNNIKSVKNPEFTDDIKKNIFRIKESYTIDSLWKPSIVENQVVAEFFPYSIIDLLSMPTKLERKSSYALSYPATRNHTINITLPEEWDMQSNRFSINSPTIYYDKDFTYDRDAKKVTLEHSFKTQKDFVSPKEFKRFFKDLNGLDTNLGFTIFTPKDGKSFGSSRIWLKVLGSIIFFLAIGIFVWLAIKLYKYDPEAVIERYFEENKQIGGWLILIGIGLCLSPFRVLYDLIADTTYISGDWLAYFGMPNFSLGLGFLLFLETITNAALVVFFPLAIILFFQRRSSFPKVYAYFLIGYLLITIIDYLMATALIDNQREIDSFTPTLVRMFITTCLIAPYLLMSERVKETFVKRLKKDN